jgi:hypothetical protein
VSEPPADILRRLRPIPTYTDQPATRPHDVVGVGTDGAPRTIALAEAAAPLLLLFLAADCDGCRDLWAGLCEIEAGLGSRARLVVLTKGPDHQDPADITALAGAALERPGIDLVMSAAAFGDYRVAAPFFVVVDAQAVRTEGVAWGVGETLRAALAGLARD